MNDDAWTCPTCGRLNQATRSICKRCNTSRDGTPPPPKPVRSAPPSKPDPNWELNWMVVLAAIGFVWWLPVALMVQLSLKDPSSGILGGIVLLGWGVIGRMGKWALLGGAASSFFTNNLPPEIEAKIFSKFSLLSGIITFMEIVAYFWVLSRGEPENVTFRGFIIDVGGPLIAAVITLFLIQRAQASTLNKG